LAVLEATDPLACVLDGDELELNAEEELGAGAVSGGLG
jgi:hypothetical protein